MLVSLVFFLIRVFSFEVIIRKSVITPFYKFLASPSAAVVKTLSDAKLHKILLVAQDPLAMIILSYTHPIKLATTSLYHTTHAKY